MQSECQLWMGNLEPNMTENFIMSAFHHMGQQPLAVKVMRNKLSGDPIGYAFVLFQTDSAAIDALHKLNGKPIPGTSPVARFRLNTASRENKSTVQMEREYSVWVGDLSPDVDDYSLYQLFSSRYSSIKTAKVIIDTSGYSKGYGFVRFGMELEQKSALYEMNGYLGLGSKPLRICAAVPKNGQGQVRNEAAPAQVGQGYGNGQDYSQYYDPSPYWQNYSGWSGYYGSGDQGDVGASGTSGAAAAADTSTEQADLLELVDHKRPVDVEGMNKEQIDPARSLWDALEESRWFPHELVHVA